MATRRKQARPGDEDAPTVNSDPGSGAHYFTAQPGVPSSTQTVAVVLPDLQLTLESDRGVFSGRHLDPGTRQLLQVAPSPPARGNLLDLGTGYGPIAVTLARRSPGAVVWAVDLNQRALELLRRNVDRAGVTNVVPARPEDVPQEVTFRAIYSNPPIRVGKASLHEMLERWLGRLDPDGRCFLVVHKNLGSDSLARWLDVRGFTTRRLASKKGYRILEVTPGTGPSVNAQP